MYNLATFHFPDENKKNMAKNLIESECSVIYSRATEEGGYMWHACESGYVLYITGNCKNLERARQICKEYGGNAM